MPFINPGHMWLIVLLLIVVLIIWGPGKLPDVGAGMGRAIREFRSATHEITGAAQATATPPPAASPNGRAPEASTAAERTEQAPVH
jgi:sec-independent protein translocase protein TatA